MTWQPFSKAIATPAALAQIVEEREGVLYWRFRCDTMFANAGMRERHNRNQAGRVVPTRDSHGYLAIRINRCCFLAHRIVWALRTGEWPRQQIDHINGVRTDNRFENLRDVSPSFNSSRRVRRGTKTGVTGVSFVPSEGVWVARLRLNGRCQHNSRHATREGAIAARKKAEADHGIELTPSEARAA